MTGLHLPRMPCDNFVYDSPCDISDSVGDCGLRRMCLHCIRLSCFLHTLMGDWSVEIRTKAARRLHGNFIMSVTHCIVWGLYNVSTIWLRSTGVRLLNFVSYKIVEPVNLCDNRTAVATSVRRPHRNGDMGSLWCP